MAGVLPPREDIVKSERGPMAEESASAAPRTIGGEVHT